MAQRFEHIVTAVDFSVAAEMAARLGYGIAEATGAALTLLYVAEPFAAHYPGASALIPGTILDRALDTALDRAEKRLAALQQSLPTRPGGPEVSTRAITSLVAEGIVSYAHEEGADLIVVGTRGHSLARDWLLGGVARKVATEARCPVLLVRGERPEHFDGVFHRIVVGVDYSRFSTPLVELVIRTLAPGGLIELLHVWHAPLLPPGPSASELDFELNQYTRSVVEGERVRLRKFADGVELSEARVALDVEVGNVPERLLSHAESIGADLIAVGAHQRERLSEKLLGTVSDRILSHAKIPVLFLPAAALATDV